MNNMNNEMNNELWQDLTEADSQMLRGGIAILIGLLLPAIQADRDTYFINNTFRDSSAVDDCETF